MFPSAGITRLDDQIFLNRNPGVPSVVKFHPFTPCVAVADKDSIWYGGTYGAGLSGGEQVAPGGVGRTPPAPSRRGSASPQASGLLRGWGLENLPADVSPPDAAHTLPGLHLATLPRALQRPDHSYMWARTGASGTKMGLFLCNEQRAEHRGSLGPPSDRAC